MNKLAIFLLTLLIAFNTMVAWGAHAPLAKDDNNNVVQGFAPNSVHNYYLTKTVSLPLTYYLAYKVQAAQDTKMYIDGDTTNYYTIYADTPETFVVNAASVTFSITSSAKASAPNLRILIHGR